MVEDKKEVDILEKTQEVVNPLEDIKKGNAELEAELERRKNLMAQLQIAGRSNAGQAQVPVETEHDKLIRETKDYFKGSLIEGYIDKARDKLK